MNNTKFTKLKLSTKRITSLDMLYDILAGDKACILSKHSTEQGKQVLLIVFSTDQTYDTYLISRNMYKTLDSISAIWPVSYKTILLDALKPLINIP